MRHPAAERGSALLITLLVMVILTLLGLSYLFLADTENLIAQNQRDSDQLLFVSEAGARMVKALFDRPAFGTPADPNNVQHKLFNLFDMRNSGYYDRTQRIFDHDGDPNTADVTADGTTARPYFRQGLTADPNVATHLTFFDKPYRGSAAASYLGTEAGPDMILQSGSLDPGDPNTIDVLDQINAAMLSDQQATGRLQRIDIYAPPVVMINGVPTRFGIATVKLTAAKFRHMAKVGSTWVTTPSSRRMGERVVKMVLNEAPYPGPAGPLQSCSGLSTNGAFAVHWGATTAVVDATIAGNVVQLQNRAPESIPWATQNSIISGTQLSDPNGPDYLESRTGTAVADPWYRLITGGTFNPPLDPNTSPGNQLQPFPYAGPPGTDDNSNLFQHSVVSCPSFDYDMWKQVSQSGFGDAHYFVWTGAGDSFRENGIGATKTFAQWTKGNRGGLFFFDTADGLPPDPNGANLTAEVALAAADAWAGGGFIYLNAQNLRQTGIAPDGVSRVLIPPGEPFVDADGDRQWDPNEQFVNLQYATTSTGSAVIDPNATQTATQTSVTGESFTYTTTTSRDDQGIPVLQAVNWYGVIYTSGTWDAQGNGAFFGSIVTRMGVLGGTAGTPDLWFDERLVKGEWPPPDLDLPRTMITVWQTDL